MLAHNISRGFDLTYNQLLAALKIFPRQTRLIPLENSNRIYGALRPETVGELTNWVSAVCVPHSQFDEGCGEHKIGIFRFYNGNGVPAAIGISSLDEKEVVIVSLAARSVQDLIPDRNIIVLTPSVRRFVTMVPLDIFDPRPDVTNATCYTANTTRALDNYLPGPLARMKIVGRVRRAVIQAAPAP